MASIEAHLETCEKCRAALTAIKHVCAGLGTHPSIAPGCPEEWAIAAFIKEELPPYNAADIRKHLERCPACTESTAIYYKAAASEDAAPFFEIDSWKNRAIMAIADVEVPAPKTTLTAKLYVFAKKVADPKALPWYAFAVAASLILIFWAAMPQQARIITIASSERIAFTDASGAASFGFMGRGRVENIRSMDISIKGDELVMRWKDIAGADEYSLTIIQVASAEAMVTGLKTKDTRGVLKFSAFQKKELYRWVISGFTAGREPFEYTGEFLIAG